MQSEEKFKQKLLLDICNQILRIFYYRLFKERY